MPRKQKRAREEKIAEDFFPVDEEDIKYSVEKPYKKPEEREIIEKTKREYKRKNNTEYKIPKIKLKEKGYELIITEKPQAAMKISSALGKSERKISSKVAYYEVDRQGKKIIVACAVGHLFTLKQTSPGSDIPTFDISWAPNFLIKKNDFSKKYYDIILKLAKNAGSITIATDYDIEGEVIGLNIIKHLCGQKDASRMKFSTLTGLELNQAYEEKSAHINWGQAIAGETRHYLDWFYGINLSRALMNAIKNAGGFKIMSIGRVQGPTLNLVVKKEREIQNFKSKDYWQAFINVKNSHELELRYNKDIFKKSELGKFKKLKGKTAKAETKKRQQILPPNPPFNLTNLQTEAYRLHGITPSKTLQIAQSLYLSGLISYPRTSSQKLPDSINYKFILKKIVKRYNAEGLIIKEKPTEGKKTDPAHPSIYPTGEMQILSRDDEKIYNLIAKRFISLFCDNAVIDNKIVSAIIDNLTFTAKGVSVKNPGWMKIYPVKLIEKEIPDLEGEVKIIKVKTEQKETQPPKRYSPASIVSELEKRNLGTKATRASVLETLYDRNYIREKSIEATPFGMSLISTLEKNSPIIIDEELTRHFEKEMDSIISAKKNLLKKEEKIINEAKEKITEIINQFEKNKKEIGKELVEANIKLYEVEREENKLNICPVCKKGNLSVKYSKKTRRYFVACDAYPECKNTYTLPPNGFIKKTDKTCEKCGFPLLIRISKGKRPWIFCFNPECAVNKKRIEEYRERKERGGENE